MKILAFAGGVGGAKLVKGLAGVMPPKDLTVVVNTGDDFEHWGIYISPDVDTICYTLAGLANTTHGWGRADETFNILKSMQELGEDDWFLLGDRDLATHIHRTRLLKDGNTLSEITNKFCTIWKILPSVFPMSNEPVHTIVDTIEYGLLPFQEYFVHQKCEPVVKGFLFQGAEKARPAPGIMEAIQKADGVIFCPSNPWVSIDPILSIPGIRPSIGEKFIVAVSPIIAGKALKGPAAKMFSELKIYPSPVAIADHYGTLLSALVIDKVDAHLENKIHIPVKVTNTIMDSEANQLHLAQDVLNLIRI
jgi:LPPG:FO 2-phospho-L-lactate transferase